MGGPRARRWYVSPEVANITVSTAGDGGTTQTRPLVLGDVPAGDIAASSSAAFAMVASPSALEKLVKWSIEKSGVSAAAELTLKQLFNTYFDTSLGQSQVDRCLPAQLHNLAISVPLAAAGGGGGGGGGSGGGGSGGGGGGSLPDTYRLADGVFGENNGVAFALARMQADCLAPSAPVHCPEGNRTVLELIAVDHAPRKALQKPQPHDLNALFSDYPFPNRGGVVPDWTTVDAAVFRDAFPLEEAWEVYEPAQQSKYWRGELTTAHNPYYGVGGGWRVRTLILRPNLELGGVLRGDTLGSLGGGTQVYYGGHMAKLFFQRVYAPTAKRQAECAQPVLEAFLGNASLPASGCVPPSAQTATPPSTTAPPAPPAPQRGPETYYEGTMGAYATALLSVSGCYILLSLLATAAFGWLAGRARWTSGPWCTGYIGAGDGSLQPGLIESVMILAGFPSAAPDLYYYDQASEDLDNRRPMGAKIAIPTSLSRRGFRGRSDDPGHRKGPLSRPHFLLRLREESPAGGLATLRWGVAQLLGWTEEVAPAHAHVATRADSTRVRWHHDAPSEPTAPPQSQRSAAVQNGAASEPAKPATSSTSQLSTLPPSAPPPSAPPPSAPPPSAPPLSAPAVAFEDDAERAKREAAAHLLGGSVAHPASHELVKLVGLLSQDNVQHAHQHGGGLPQELRASIDRLQLLLVPQAHQLHESSERYREAAVRAYEQRRQAWERVQRVLCCAGAWAAPGPSVNDSHHDHTSHMWRTTMLAAHYGKQKFRSDSLAVFIVLGSLTHVMAKAFNQGSYLGPSRLYGDRWIFTKIVHESFLSPVELHLASALQPLVWDGATAGYLRFATLLETFLIAVPTVVHVVLLSVGNVEGSHRGWVVVSLAYTLLLVADGFLYRYVCLDQLERLFTGDAASSQPPSPLCAPDKYYVSYYGGQGDNLIVKNFIAPFEAFSFYATLIILILYVVRTTHLHAETVAQTDGRPSATRAELLKSLSNVARGVERRLAEWFFNALRLLIGASKQQVTEIKFPVMLAAATVTEIAVSCAVVVLGAFLQEKIQEIKTSALDVMDVVVGATSRSLAFDQLVSSIGGVAVGVETCTVGDEQLDPGAASTLNDLVSTVIYTWLPILREAIPVLVEHCIVGGVVGCCLSFLLTLKGIRKTWATFYELYGLLYTHQHTCMRTPLRKANSVRLMSTLIFYQLFGFTLVVAFCSFMGLLIGLASVEWPGKLWLRALFANALIAQLTEMAYVRTCVTPLFQLFECGPALFVINLWYMSLGLIKGITRISLLLCLVILSNFSPHQCMFPDGMEAWDSAHVCFTCYVMERVVQDHHDRHLIGKSKGLMKGVLQFQHAGHAMDRAKVSPDPDEAGAKPKAPPDPDATTDGADMVHKFAEPSAAEPSTERSAEPSLPMARIHLPPPDLSASPRC